MVGSRVPSSSIRRRTTSVALSIASSSAVSIPAEVGASTMRCPSTTDRSHSRVRFTPCINGSISPRARSISAGLSSMKDIRPSPVDTSPMRMRGLALRISCRTFSSMFSSRWTRTSAALASSSRCDPPARSSPRLTCGLGKADGQSSPDTLNSDGSASTAAANVRPHSQSFFQRGKSSIASGFHTHRRRSTRDRISHWPACRPAG